MKCYHSNEKHWAGLCWAIFNVSKFSNVFLQLSEIRTLSGDSVLNCPSQGAISVMFYSVPKIVFIRWQRTCYDLQITEVFIWSQARFSRLTNTMPHLYVDMDQYLLKAKASFTARKNVVKMWWTCMNNKHFKKCRLSFSMIN